MGMAPPTLSEQAKQALQNYSFPGNVRELENIIERAMTLCESNTIEAGDLRLNDSATKLHTDTASGGLEEIGLEAYLENIERDLLQQALEKAQHNKTAAARRLGITFRALRYRLKKLGLG
jgi:two-component system response regulator PilR (NtrC family)